ncbi:drug/metabolite transporter (DMT)-like permease [Chitinophaga dinghuensis]|uniref:Drug/metabolite transporter (DMT)-like permease n=1 Tax=Chitinophaga dinghuensis TaxID=1539050 RepID=A0A327VP31_9BACT|nr:DMT family transporter [Chitinophaga dinghuensis]RAJ75585.1 drug/metabolite transporter (DMT)-like permease [Chitinophaga dinghuensis]
MNQKIANWGVFLLLSLTWGSSFILMKIGLESFSPYQVASLRLVAAGLALLPFLPKYLKETPIRKLPIIILSGILGNGLPAFLFCLAETKIDSSLAGILNSLTPLMALLTGFLIFHSPIKKAQLTGVGVGLIGVALLFSNKGIATNEYWYYGLLVIAATVSYGANISLVHHHLKGYGSLQLGSIAMFFCGLFTLPILLFTDFFPQFTTDHAPWRSLAAGMVLGVMGTGVAAVLFYLLIRRAGAMFASMVTYALPIVAMGWGLLAHEAINSIQIACMLLILFGVYLVNRAKDA